MKSWKKRWLTELDEKIPSLSKEVKDAPIYTAPQPQKQPFSLKAWIKAHKQRFTAALATCTAAVVTLSVVLPIALQRTPGMPGGGGLSASASSSVITYTPTVLCLEINPKAVFSVSKDGIVTDVVATNNDADVILSNPARVAEMEGKTAKEAVKVFVDYAAKLGYLNLNEQSAVRLTEYQNETAYETDVVGELETYFKSQGAMIVVCQDTLSGEAFYERAGLAETLDKTQGLDGLMQGLPNMAELYTSREAEKKTSENELQELYEQFVPAETREHYEIMIGFLEKVAPELAELYKALIALPKTITECQEKLQKHFANQFDELEKKHKNAYTQSRNEIADGDYDNYLAGIIQEHGSLDAYWESLKNK